MDQLWNDDPEELLLELGFGCDEPDLSGRIPARFINYQSQARGINLQVFLDAQKNRIDLENPDVSNRFRQLEVLQQVSVAFSSLAGPNKGPYAKDMSPEARERRRRMGMLFRRASKKSLSQLHGPNTQDLNVATANSTSGSTPKPLEPIYGPEEKKVSFKRVKLQDTVNLSPFVEEEGDGPESEHQLETTVHVQEGEPRPGTLRERYLDKVLQRKKSLGQTRESFEMEEVCSFDESSAVGFDSGGTHFVRGMIRANSCQSDSSGFLEDPLIPTLPPETSPAPDLIKALSALSGGSTDSHSSDMPLHSSLCTPNASDHTPEPFNQTVPSDQLRTTVTNLDDGVPSQLKSSEWIPQENEKYENVFSSVHGPLAVKHQKIGTNRKTSDSYDLHKTMGMEEKTVYFVSSPKMDAFHRSPIPSTQFDKFPHLTHQNSVSEEVYHSQEKTETPAGSPFLSRQDSVESLHTNDFGSIQSKQDIIRSDVESAVSNSGGTRLAPVGGYLETEIDAQVIACNTQDRVIEESHSKDCSNKSKKVSNGFGDYTKSEELIPKVSELIEIESLDDVFETSVDASEVDSGDVEAFFQELNSIGQVYWAEPIHIADLSPQSDSFENLDTFQENSELARESDLDVLPSTDKAIMSSSRPNDRSLKDSTEFSTPAMQSQSSSLSLATLEEKPLKHSISVQMLSSASSHIVHRKDVPYVDDSKHPILPRHFKLDTSNPFRAVQSWTNLHIQQNPNTRLASKVSTSAGGNLNRPPESYWPSYPVLAHEWQSDDCLHRVSREEESLSVSLDTGLWADEEDEDVDRTGEENSGHKCNCCKQNSQPHMLSESELEELLLCLHQFRSVLRLMEEQLTEDQAAVYNALTHHDRQKLEELLRLRQAVRQEVLELELQLRELVYHDDQSITTNMHRLLDEQSLLCSQLRLFSPGPLSPLSGPIYRRTVATQCSLQQGPPHNGPREASTHSQLQPASSHQGLGCAPAKTDKLHLVGFLHRLRDSLRHSVNTDLKD